MRKNPRISVIIGAYNEEAMIAETLKSIRAQKFRSYELIVVDNGSTDHTARIARKYARVVVERRRGVSIARNSGAGAARGKILLFLDADVHVPQGFLSAVNSTFADKSVVAASGPILPLERVGITIRLLYGFLFDFLVGLSVRLRMPYFIAANFAVRRDVFERIHGFDEELVTCEDGDITQRASRYGRAVFARNLLVYGSARRMLAWGEAKYIGYGIVNLLQYYIFNRPRTDYEPVRYEAAQYTEAPRTTDE